jgi:hypothetical protein
MRAAVVKIVLRAAVGGILGATFGGFSHWMGWPLWVTGTGAAAIGMIIGLTSFSARPL